MSEQTQPQEQEQEAALEQPKQKRRPYTKNRKPRPSKREEILQSATKVLCWYGYDGTSLERIAQEAGVSKSLVSKHWGTKEDIAAIVLKRILHGFFDKAKRISGKAESYPQQTEEVFSLIRNSRSEFRFILSLFATPSLEHIVREIIPNAAENTNAIVANTASGIVPTEDIPALTYTIMGLYFNYVLTGREDVFNDAKAHMLRHYLGE